MGKQGVKVFSRPLRYHRQEIKVGDGGSIEISVDVPVEKGIDVRLAIDAIRLALHDKYDVAILFSQDQDLSEAVEEIRLIAAESDRWIEVASAFPAGSRRDRAARRGVNNTQWIPIDEAMYMRCIDQRDYRPKRK